MKPGRKRVIIEMDTTLHTTLKVMAAKKYMTLRNLLLIAIAEMLEKEPNEKEIMYEK